MNIATPIVAIEITRRCNLNCEHCMRGDSENIDISRELLEKFFDEVKSANVLVLSGGEPFLCYEQIRMLLEVMAEKKVRIPKVAIVTNGTVYDERIYKLLEAGFEKIVIDISIDEYHIKSIESLYGSNAKSSNPRLAPMNVDEVADNIELHKRSPYFRNFYNSSPKYLLESGRARNLDKPKRPLRPLGYFYSDCSKNFLIGGPRIYLDPLGNIAEGDSEYASRSELSIGNLHDSKLSDLLIFNAIRIDAPSENDFTIFLFDREQDYADNKGKNYGYRNNKVIELDKGLERARARIC